MENGIIQEGKMSTRTFINLVTDYAVARNSELAPENLKKLKFYFLDNLADTYHAAQEHVVDIGDFIAPLDVMVQTIYDVTMESYKEHTGPDCFNCDTYLANCKCGDTEVISPERRYLPSLWIPPQFP